VNRSVTMANRYLGGERPSPAPDGALGALWPELLERYRARLEGLLLHDALAVLWEFVGAANRFVDAEQPWTIAKGAKAGDAAAEKRLRDVLGDLLEACRLIALAAAPFLPGAAPRVLAQLGYEYPYAAEGKGGPPLLEQLQWAAHSEEDGRLGSPEPLFPRLEADPA